MGWRILAIASIIAPLQLIAEQLPIRSYTMADGLAADRINCIVPDSRGFIWFCTPEGLTRFDGARLVTFGPREGLPDRAVESFLESRSGAYFVGTDRGLSEFNARPGSSGFHPPRPGADLLNRPVFALLESAAGKIWCGTSSLAVFETSSSIPLQLSQPAAPPWVMVSDMKEGRHGKLWIATTAGIYVVGTNQDVRHVALQNRLSKIWANALLVDRAGRIWAAARGALVLLGDEPEGVQRVYTQADGMPTDDLLSLAEAPNGDIWIGTAAGISILPQSGQPPFRNLGRADGLTGNSITALAFDRSGNLWAGTGSSGAMRIASNGFVTFGKRDGLAEEKVDAVLTDRSGEVLAVPSNRSLNILDRSGLAFHAVVPRLFSGWGFQQVLLQARTGEWWEQTNDGLCRFGPSGASQLADRQPQCYARDVKVHAVFEDSKGGIWASAQSDQGDRLFRWDPGSQKIRWYQDGPGQHELVMAFAQDRTGNIWMGPSQGDLFCYRAGGFTRFKPGGGAPRGVVTALLVDRSGRLWTGSSSGGLGVIDNPESAPLRIHIYDSSNGLASDSVFSLVEDGTGRIYAATGKGIDRLDPVTGTIRHFTTADGLAHGLVRSSVRDASGNLWFASTQGLSRLTPTADRPPARPTVLITSLTIFGKPYPVSQAGEALIRLPQLDPSKNQLQVTYAGFNDEPEESLRYASKLEGADADWRQPNREHEANYPGLTPGSYRFLVKAVNSEGQASLVPAAIQFEVLPPFWRRAWFLAIVGLSAAGGIYALHRFRVSHLVEMERVRTRIATDLHDDIGATLSRMAIMTEVVKRQVGAADGNAGRLLTEIAETSRGLVDEMSDIVWSIDPRHGDLRSVAVRIREFGSAVLETQNIRWDFQVSQQLEDLKLTAEQRRHFFLIFKEAIHNITRHAGCSTVQAGFRVAGNQLVGEIRDDGCGFPSGRRGAGHGLKNMQARAAEIGGVCAITSAPGCGAEIKLTIPLKKLPA